MILESKDVNFNGAVYRVPKLTVIVTNQIIELMNERGIQESTLMQAVNDTQVFGTLTSTTDVTVLGWNNVVESYEDTFKIRSKTGNLSRVARQSPALTDMLSIRYKLIDPNTVTVENAWYGEQIPYEPNNPHIRLGDLKESIEFWSSHAFIDSNRFERNSEIVETTWEKVINDLYITPFK